MKHTLKLAFFAVALIALATSFVMVDESEFVIVERFGRIRAVYDRPGTRGLHGKLPWPIDTVRRFDGRVRLLDPPGREVFTADGKNIIVDSFACWRISESASNDTPFESRPVVRYFRSLGNETVAAARMGSRLRSIVSSAVGSTELDALLNTSQGRSKAEPESRAPAFLKQLSASIAQTLQGDSAAEGPMLKEHGIEIIDVRIKRLNFPEGNQQAVFDRMRSERRRIANRYRSAGEADEKMIRSRADRRYEEILALAQGEAERIRGKAEAESVALLNAAHSQDPQLYRFLLNLESYKTILGDKTTLVLSASTNLFRLLTDGPPVTIDTLPDRPSVDSANAPNRFPDKSSARARSDEVPQ